MMLMFDKIFGIIIITLTNVYIWCKLLRRKLELKKSKPYIVMSLMSISTFINYYYNNKYIRILTITILMAIFIKILFKDTIKKSILVSIVAQIIYMVSEILFIAMISFCFNLSSLDIAETQFGTATANLIIAIISIIIVNFPIVLCLFNFLVKITDKIKNNQLIFTTFLIGLIANILAMIIYYQIKFRYLLIFNTLLTIAYFGIVLYTLNTKNKYNKVYDKYNTTLNSLKEYEDILDKYKIYNHENKNQLLTIRNMIDDKNKNVVKYIDKLVKNQIKDDEIIMQEVSIIPSGGLRGLVYSKVLDMKQKQIEYELNISKDIRTVDLINKLDDSDILDICQVIGVYIDNAVQAVIDLKEKYVNLEMYLDKENLIFEISNYYEGNIELDKLDEKGYTTKGYGHGYGLTLTREIIDRNKRLENKKKLSKQIFTQVLKIKMK